MADWGGGSLFLDSEKKTKKNYIETYIRVYVEEVRQNTLNTRPIWRLKVLVSYKWSGYL